ncbi:hypothetical protein [Novosphingobium sp.]|uniref:hypothetical protein n=1 Tax=Novosphingobium sp. TaxID=1874826 RepID=UPI00262A595C|nr:hypothetical protein [Novosphingobium sp.]
MLEIAFEHRRWLGERIDQRAVEARIASRRRSGGGGQRIGTPRHGRARKMKGSLEVSRLVIAKSRPMRLGLVQASLDLAQPGHAAAHEYILRVARENNLAKLMLSREITFTAGIQPADSVRNPRRLDNHLNNTVPVSGGGSLPQLQQGVHHNSAWIRSSLPGWGWRVVVSARSS